jgi:hypothetical protein
LTIEDVRAALRCHSDGVSIISVSQLRQPYSLNEAIFRTEWVIQETVPEFCIEFGELSAQAVHVRVGVPGQ